jgi:hypothetical protein
MVARGLAGGRQRAAEASARLPYPDADISSYAKATAHLKRGGERRARELFENGELEWGE